MSLRRGSVVGERFRLDAKIGEGGFGVVWRGTDLNSDVTVALKFLKPFASEDLHRRFALEAETLQRLNNPRCVRLLSSGVCDGRPYLATEFVPGVRLFDWLQQPRSDAQKDQVCRQIIEGLTAAHQLGIVHRDLKPDNVMVDDHRLGLSVKLLDFGISRLAGAHPTDITKTGEVIGTPGYMSPEQLRGEAVGRPTDVYALGVVFFEIFEGRPPFVGDSPMSIAVEHLTSPVPACLRAPAHVRDLIPQMLSKSPDQRPSLSRVGEAFGLAPPRAAEVEVPPRRPAAWALALVGVVAIWAAIALLKEDAPEPAARVQAPHFDGAALVKATAPRVDPVADGGRPDAADDAGLRAGCGRPLPQGPVLLVDDESGFDLWAYVPNGYDAQTPATSVWVLHDFGISAERLVHHEALVKLAENAGHVLIIPNDAKVGSVWTKSADADRLRAEIATASEMLCLDPERRFVLGLGTGGAAVRRLSCAGIFARSATVGTRYTTTESACRGQAIPLFHVSGTDDPSAPIEGGAPCWSVQIEGVYEGDRVISLEQQEEQHHKAHVCSGAEQPYQTAIEGLECKTARCEIENVWCRTGGGRFLPGMPPDPDKALLLASMVERCRKPLAVDPLPAVWEFFARHTHASDRNP